MWNTGCNVIHNDTGHGMFIFDQEEGGEGGDWSTDVTPTGSTRNYHGTIFPWCINSWEVRTKAFRIYFWDEPAQPKREVTRAMRGDPVFLVFQNYRDDQIWYIRPEGSQVDWSKRMWCGEGPSSWADLYLTADKARVQAVPA